uniref:Uncharacterized protein n=1 Tax=Arundo donax TaxID=35708 RepID=A0A0A8Z7K2_ARUDO
MVRVMLFGNMVRILEKLICMTPR